MRLMTLAALGLGALAANQFLKQARDGAGGATAAGSASGGRARQRASSSSLASRPAWRPSDDSQPLGGQRSGLADSPNGAERLQARRGPGAAGSADLGLLGSDSQDAEFPATTGLSDFNRGA